LTNRHPIFSPQRHKVTEETEGFTKNH
jgi:hypothetical protein